MLFLERFSGRVDAGRQLAAKLIHLKDKKPLVLGLPRGGIPVAAEIARALNAPLEPLFVKKIGAPDQPELAIGAVADGPRPQIVINDQACRVFGEQSDYIRRQVDAKLQEIEARRQDFMGNRQPMDPAGRTVVLVDDGIATGSTVQAALAVLSKSQPAKLVLVVPVLPASSVEDFEKLVDELVYLKAPKRLRSVGEHYRDFRQVGDETVRELLVRQAGILARQEQPT